MAGHGTVGEVYAKVHADTKDFGHEAESGMKSSLGGVAKMVGEAFAVEKVGEFFGDVISEASHAQQTMHRTTATFGAEQAEVLEKWAGSQDKAFGLSREQALTAADTFGILFESMKLPTDKSVDMSKNLTGLASDLAAFKGVPVEDAMNALSKGVTGATKPLKQFGIVIDAGMIKQKAMELGLYDGTGALSASAKAQASYALILEQSTAQQGAFGRQSGDLAGQAKILKAEWSNAKEELGNALLPVVTKIATFFAENLGPAIDKGKAALAGFKDIIAEVVANWQKYLPELVAAGVVVSAILVAWAAESITAAAGFLVMAAPIIAVVAAIAAIAGALVYAYQNWTGFREVVDGVVSWFVGTAWPALQAVWDAIVAAAAAVAQAISDHWNQIMAVVTAVVDFIVLYVTTEWNVLVAVVTAVLDVILAAWHLWGDDLMQYLTGLWNIIVGIVTVAFGIVRGVIQTVLALIRGDWGAAWDAIKQMLSTVWDGMKQVVQGAVDQIKALIGAGWDLLKTTTSAAWNLIKGYITDPINAARDAVKTAVDAIVGFFTGIGGRIGGAVSGMFDGIGSAMNSAISTVKSAWNSFARFWNGIGIDIPAINIGPVHVGGGRIDLPNLPTFHTGGVAIDDVLAVLRRDETVFTPTQLEALSRAMGRTGRGGPAVNIEHAEFADALDVEVFGRVVTAVMQSEGVAA